MGSYELRAILGRGSYGTVYLAWDDDHSRGVAAKALDPSLVAAPGFLERFRVEASVLGGISHPNVVAVLNYLEDQRGAWLITEYVHGTSLATVLARAGTLAPEQALGVLSGALSGLEHVHAKGLVHGDIKPANILVSSEGISKLADFGQTASSGQRPGAGTAAYISPEAARGEPVDARSDIYSAGVVLYEALTGRLPFAATSELALLRMHVTQPAPRATGLHPHLADLLERMLAKDPEQRPQSVGEVLDELEAAAETAYGAAWRRRAGIEGLIASLIAGAGVLAAGAPAAGAPVTLHPPVPTAPPAPTPGAHDVRVGSTAPHATRRVARTSSRVARTLAAHKTTSGLVATAIVAAAATGALLTHASHGHTRLASSDAPTISTVNIAGSPGNYTLTISGSGFGSFAGSLPYDGDVPNFRIADSAQIGFGEWGYIGDANQLDYETWTANKIVVGGLGAAPGDALALAVWNRDSGSGASWGGNVPPAPSGPRISSVTFSGSTSSPQIVVRGSGFGEPPARMPYSGSVQSFVLSDWRAYHAGNGPSGTWTSGVTEDFKSWSNNTIVIDGLGGTYGQAPNMIEPGDPVTIQIWSPASAFDKGPQTAWGGRATFSSSAHFTGITEAARGWSNLTAAAGVAPSARSGAAMVYDAADGYMLLFGGASSSAPLAETWTFKAGHWSQLHPAKSPAPRSNAAIAYDTADDEVVLFGGNGTAGTNGNSDGALADTWTFKGGEWSPVNANAPSNCGSGATACAPPPSLYPSMTYDAAARDVVLFGGDAGTSPYANQTWAFKNEKWSQITNLGSAPAGRAGAGLVDDEASGQVLMFGGSSDFESSGAGLDETWQLSAHGWSELTPPTSPVDRDDFGFTYDPATRSALLFGGWNPAGACGSVLGDSWSLSNGNWSQLSTAASPSPRQGVAMAYDPSLDGVLLFGGVSGTCGVTPTLFADTWVYRAKQ